MPEASRGCRGNAHTYPVASDTDAPTPAPEITELVMCASLDLSVLGTLLLSSHAAGGRAAAAYPKHMQRKCLLCLDHHACIQLSMANQAHCCRGAPSAQRCTMRKGLMPIIGSQQLAKQGFPGRVSLGRSGCRLPWTLPKASNTFTRYAHFIHFCHPNL